MATIENIEDLEEQSNLQFGRFLSHPESGEEVCITGLGGTFPEADHVNELKENLLNKIDMITDSTSRWLITNPEIPKRTGKIKRVDSFDAGFFGVSGTQGTYMCPLVRITLEKVVEAICDAGVNPKHLADTRTGVFVGATSSETENLWFCQRPENGLALTGCMRSMIAHRISYFLKLNSISVTMDAACSSSMMAFDNAYRSIRQGDIDAALVCGSSIALHPYTNLQFARLGVLSKDGRCKVFDNEGDGYTRSEALVAIFLQKKKDSKRIYATVIHSKINSDGYKEKGITYPSKEMQKKLVEEFYSECQVDPTTLSYFEAHGTGTKVGDPEELLAVDKIFTTNRKSPLLIGSIKSNIGHTEPASGLCSIIKCIIAYETGLIPPNIHFNTPRKEITGLVEGRMKVVTENTPFEDDRGLAAVSNFGFGGSNGHALLKWHPQKKVKKSLTTDDLPRLVCISSRVPEGVDTFLDEVRSTLDLEFIGLLHNLFREDIPNHIYRGFSIISKTGEAFRSCNHVGNLKPLYLVFGGYESNWKFFGQQFLKVQLFKESIQKIQDVVTHHKINVINIIASEANTILENIFGSIAVKIALCDILKNLKLTPNGIIGFSLGELVCAYYDGCLTLEETVLSAFTIAKYVEIVDQPALCYLVNLDISQLTKILPPQVHIQAINSKNSAVISGNPESVRNFVSKLVNHNIEVKNLGYQVVDFQGDLFLSFKPQLIKELSTVLKNPKQFSQLHIFKSNVITSAEFFVDNFVNVTSLKDFVANTEKKCVVFEIGHGFLESSILEATDNFAYYNSIESNNDSYILGFLITLGRLYEHSYNTDVAKFYPQIQFPVSRGTPSISSLIRWNHTQRWETISFKRVHDKVGQRTYKLNFSKEGVWNFAHGHVIDGRNLFPATGFLKLVWDTLGYICGFDIEYSKVVFQNCRFLRAVNCVKEGDLELIVMIQRGSGKFEIIEGDQAVVTGNIYLEDGKGKQLMIQQNGINDDELLPLKSKDIYKELRLRGYNYSGLFRGLIEVNGQVTQGRVKWMNNWVAFLDNLLQMKILEYDSRLLYVPTSIKKISIDAPKHIECIKQKGTEEESEIDAYICPLSGVIRCGGVQVDGLSASAIARKKPLGEPVLEKSEFVPYITNLTIENSTRVNMQIVLENQFELKVKVVEVIDEETQLDSTPLGPLIFNVLSDQPLIQADVTILSPTPMELQNVVVETNKLESHSDCLVVIISNALSRPQLVQTAFKSLKDYGYIVSREKLDFLIDSKEYQDLEIISVHTTKTEKLLLLRKPVEFNRVTAVNVENLQEQFTWLPQLQNAIAKNSNVVVYALNEPHSGILGMVNCIRREPGCYDIRCVFATEKVPNFDQYNPFYYDQLKKNLAVNIYKNGTWGTYRHLALEENESVLTEHRYVNIATRGDISSLTWYEGHLHSNYDVGPEKSLVYTYFIALNFRDIMTATNKITPDVITRYRPDQENVQGFEFAGKTISGKRVCGLISCGAFSTLNTADSSMLFEIPDDWTMEDAATVVVVYLTVIYGLFYRVKMKRGETVLIHSGTGGVGQAAIQLALHFGCHVFTTVGTPEKREFIKKRFPELTDNHIGNSRDTSFETLIMEQTKGVGVDIVLNSLAEEKLQASVRCLAHGGRFVEIGKFDLANDNRLKLLDFEKEQSFHGVMLDSIFYEPPMIKLEMNLFFKECLKSGAIKPLNRTIFKDDELENAFRFMMTGKHTGKVLVQLRTEEKEINAPPKVSLYRAVPRYFCHPEKSYIITGGLGGFGLELADWLVLRGARKLVLTSRSGIKNGYQTLRIKIWRSYGALIEVSTADISNKDGCEELLKTANALGPVEAIFNLAVVLKDTILENQSIESFKESYKPKALATKYLDVASRTLCPTLRNFVIFSSVSCGRGNAGQANYGYSNSVMERICEKRKAEGYPALAIQWGAIGEVGLVADMQEENTEIEIGGTLQQRISSCLQVMDTFLRCSEPVVSSMVVAEKKSGSGGADNIIDAVAHILGIKDMKAISYHSSLAELGMDSMTAVEIKQTLEREFEVFLTPQDIRSMTFSRLQEIQEEKSQTTDSPVSNAKKVETNFLSQLFRLMGEEGIVNVPMVKLNSKLSDNDIGPKVLFYPGIEGTGYILNDLSENLNAHAVAVQYCPENHGLTIKEIAENTLPFAEAYFSKSEPFTIIAHSFGVPVALEAIQLLEDKGFTGKLICIDGSPQYIQNLSKMVTANFRTDWEVSLMLHILSNVFNSEFAENHREKIEKCKDFDEMISVMEKIVGHQKAQSTSHMKGIADGSFKRVNAMISYNRVFKTLKSKVILLKPTIPSVMGLTDDYGLSEDVGQDIDVHVFEADHLTILSNADVSKFINLDIAEDVTFAKETIVNFTEFIKMRPETMI